MASVDVVIPNYNYARYLRPCVESVLNQSIDDLRILIIDNASSDDSVAVARELAARDSRIEVRAREENLGYHASINEGIDWAASDYVVALCSDDLLAPSALGHALSVLEAHPDVSYAYGRYIEFQDGTELPTNLDKGADTAWRLWDGAAFIKHNCSNLVLTVSPVVRTSVQKKVGHYRPELQFTDDLEMMMRLARFGRVAETPAIMTMQRVHQANISHATWGDPVRGLRDEEAMFNTFFAHEGSTMPEARRLHRTARRTVGKKAYRLALVHLVRGPRKTAFDLIKYTYSVCPKYLIVPPVGYLFNYVFRRGHPYERIKRFFSSAPSRPQENPWP